MLDMVEPILIRNLARDLIELSGLRPGKDVDIQVTKMHPGEKLIEVLVDDLTEKLQPTRIEKICRISSEPFNTKEFFEKLGLGDSGVSRGSCGDL
jgi:FlaA1/EpsC-like NDP-sugar epimerase